MILLCGLASRTEEKGERELFSYCGYYVYHSCHRDLRSTMGGTPQTQRVPQINPPPFRLLLFGCFITTTRKVTNAAHSVLCGLRNKSLNSKSWSRERSWNIILQPETNSPTPWMQMAQKAIPESLWEKQRGVRRWSVQRASPQGQENLYEKQDPRAKKGSVSHGKSRHSH